MKISYIVWAGPLVLHQSKYRRGSSRMSQSYDLNTKDYLSLGDLRSIQLFRRAANYISAGIVSISRIVTRSAS